MKGTVVLVHGLWMSGAEMFLPIFEASGGRYGWISGQLDPRLFTETDQMVHDAEVLHSLSPNVMIKVPASMQGMDVLRILASKAISTNTTGLAMDMVDQWMENLLSDASSDGYATKVVRAKPAGLVDGCWDPAGLRIDDPATLNPASLPEKFCSCQS